MVSLARTTHWAEEHTYGFLEIGRVCLGIILLHKGLQFMGDTVSLLRSIDLANIPFASLGLSHFIIAAHILGGVMIIMGLKTRWAAAVQLPILIGAVALVQYGPATLAGGGSFGLAVLTLVLLIVYLFFGSGRFSLDEYLGEHEHDEDAEEPPPGWHEGPGY